jgi:HSP20 family protein
MLSHLADRFGTPFIASFPTLHRETAGDGQADLFRPGFGSISVWEDAEHFYVDADVPGLTVDEIELVIEDGKLRILGKRGLACRGQKCWRQERFEGEFERVIVLADLIDREKIEAELKAGVLSITLSKKAEAKPQRIEIRGQSQRFPQIA